MSPAKIGPARRASSVALLSALLLAVGCGSDTADSDDDSFSYPSANEDVPQSSVGGNAVTVDGLTVEVSSASVAELDGEPVVAVTIKATNDGDEDQVSPQAFVICNNGEAAIERGGDYPAASGLAPGAAAEGETLLSFGAVDGRPCELPITVDVRFGGTLGGLATLTDESLSAAQFAIDDALAADITSAVFDG